MPVTWPLRTYLELGALPSAVPCARLHARQVLWEWGLCGLAETVELVVSELMTNAVRATEGLTGRGYRGEWNAGLPPVRLWLSSDRQRVLIQVWDGDHHMPVRSDTEDLDAECGRGLMLVECVSVDWGSFAPEGSSGKLVWSVIG